MKEKAAPAPPNSAPGESTPTPSAGPAPARLTPGVATLLRGTNVLQQSEPAKQEQGRPNGEPLAATKKLATPNSAVRISLVLADLLLLVLAARLVVKAKGHVGFLEIALCVVALGLGAWLSCLA